MAKDYSTKVEYDLQGKFNRAFLNDTYQINFWFYPDADAGPTACFSFRLINSDTARPIRFQNASAVNFDHTEKMAHAFLRHWSQQHAEFGCTGVVPPEEIEPDAVCSNGAICALNKAIEDIEETRKAKAAFIECATRGIPGVKPVAPLHRAVEAFCTAMAASGFYPKELVKNVDWEELAKQWLSEKKC